MIIEKILRENPLNREQILLIGDSVIDNSAAEKCGIKFIGIKSKTVKFPGYLLSFDNFTEIENVWDRIV